MKALSNNAIKTMLEMLDFSDDVDKAIDEEIQKRPNDFIDLVKQKSDESRRYCDLISAFTRIINSEYENDIEPLYYIVRDSNNKHKIQELSS
jgi:hypothetical protein